MGTVGVVDEQVVDRGQSVSSWVGDEQVGGAL